MTATTKRSAQKYPYIVCRAVTGHRWEANPANLPKAPVPARARFGWTFDCFRCGMSKDVFYDKDGYTIYTRYRQPQGYRTDTERQELRLVFLEATRKRKP